MDFTRLNLARPCRLVSWKTDMGRTPEISSRCLILGGEEIPTNFEFVCALFGWFGILFEKNL